MDSAVSLNVVSELGKATCNHPHRLSSRYNRTQHTALLILFQPDTKHNITHYINTRMLLVQKEVQLTPRDNAAYILASAMIITWSAQLYLFQREEGFQNVKCGHRTMNLPHYYYHYYYYNYFMALWILSGATQVSQYQKKHSPTHTYHDHQSSLICFPHLLRSM